MLAFPKHINIFACHDKGLCLYINVGCCVQIVQLKCQVRRKCMAFRKLLKIVELFKLK
jgi:hypothetical protein